MILLLTTVSSADEGETLAHGIIEARLAACVQILPQMTSIYVWQDKTLRETEHLLLIKTLPEKFDELRDFITANHSYDVPEIVAIDAEHMSGPYLDWIKSVLA